MASCAHVPAPKFQDSDLRRPIAASFPGAYDLRALSWTHVRVWGAAGRGWHTPAWLGIARFARSSYVNRALFGISTSAPNLICIGQLRKLESELPQGGWLAANGDQSDAGYAGARTYVWRSR